MPKQFLIFFLSLLFLNSCSSHKITLEVSPGFYKKEVKLSPFVSDGCSLFPNGPKEKPDAWTQCCIEHDTKYWLGGTKEQRKQADEELFACVKRQNYPITAFIMYLGTRIGGESYSLTTYRWGYGWNYIRGYAPLSSDEMLLAENIYGPNLEMLTKGLKENTISYKKVAKISDYKYHPEQKDICKEQIFEHLSEHLTTKSSLKKISQYSTTKHHVFQVKLSTCDKSIEYKFNQGTSAQTCTRAFIDKNILENVDVPENCKSSILN